MGGLSKFEVAVLIWVSLLFATTCAFVGASVLADETMSKRDAFNMAMQWLSAVGTVGAMATALWLGLRSRLDQDKREHAAAVLVAAGIAPLLSAVIEEMTLVSARVWFTDSDELSGPFPDNARIYADQETTYEKVSRIVALPVFDHGVETTTQLLPLSSQAAQRFYAGRSLMRHVQRESFSERAGMAWRAMGIHERHSYLKGIESQISEAVEYLTLANQVFTAATSLANMRPTPEELYGDQ